MLLISTELFGKLKLYLLYSQLSMSLGLLILSYIDLLQEPTFRVESSSSNWIDFKQTF